VRISYPPGCPRKRASFLRTGPALKREPSRLALPSSPSFSRPDRHFYFVGAVAVKADFHLSSPESGGPLWEPPRTCSDGPERRRPGGRERRQDTAGTTLTPAGTWGLDDVDSGWSRASRLRAPSSTRRSVMRTPKAPALLAVSVRSRVDRRSRLLGLTARGPSSIDGGHGH
jgi:hypothetical protein